MTADKKSNHDHSFIIDEDSMEGMYLTFNLATEGYGIEIRHVIEPPPATGRNRKNYIAGMGKIGQQVQILLKIEALLEDEELQEVEA